MNEEVRTIMSTKVTTANPSQSIAEVLAILERKRLQQLPVVDADGKLVGLITSYDLWKHCQDNPGCEKHIVARVMTRSVVKLNNNLEKPTGRLKLRLKYILIILRSVTRCEN